ncbi:hypothetical protein II906_11875 [bacterium]|nr:hypothetical protein [bacterium]
MDKINLNKSAVNTEGINSIIEEFCTENNIDNETLLKMQLVSEEFLTNILFPNFQDNFELAMRTEDAGVILSFDYEGPDFMNKINDVTFLAQKIIDNKTKSSKSTTKDNKTVVEFVI